jgi:fatty acid desaturase
MLYATWPVFLKNPKLFRFIHISHHTYTNQGKMDPDHFTAGSTLASRWVRSMSLLFAYYFYAYFNLRRQIRFSFQFGTTIIGPALVLGAAILTGRYDTFLGLWMAPAFVGIGILSFANTSWPHHPGKETDRMKNTRNLFVPRALQWIMCNQNLHLVHHLHPTLPWYQYPEYYRKNEEKLKAAGAALTIYTSRPNAYEP